VVCLHRARAHARRFERLARMLTGHRRVIAYDLRGHGRSPWSGPHTLAQHVADLDEVLDAVGADHTALIGDGFGCRIALEYAAAHGGRVTALGLLDPPLRPQPDRMLALADMERDGQVFSSVEAAAADWPGFAGLKHTPRVLLEEDLAEHLVADHDGRLRFRYSHDAAAAALAAMAEPVTVNLKEVVCPVLLVRGDHSQVFTAADAERAAAELRRCKVEVVPGGHTPLWDSLAETGALVKSFVSGQRTRA
jgi:pimeloyl-ACP methyl ester carboxylesterase